MDKITILTPIKGRKKQIATKQLLLDADGNRIKIDYNKTAKDKTLGIFEHLYSCRECSNIYDLSRLLLELETDFCSFPIRGELRPHVKSNQRVYRRKLDRVGKPAHFQESKYHWLPMDLDDIPLSKLGYGDKVITDIDINDAAWRVLQLLNEKFPAFKDVTFHYQLSTSCGWTKMDEISFHFFFWSAEPIFNEHLKILALYINEQLGFHLVDEKIYHAVQPFYTSHPFCHEGVTNPFPIRSGLIKGTSDELILDISELDKQSDLLPSKPNKPRSPKKPTNATKDSHIAVKKPKRAFNAGHPVNPTNLKGWLIAFQNIDGGLHDLSLRFWNFVFFRYSITGLPIEGEFCEQTFIHAIQNSPRGKRDGARLAIFFRDEWNKHKETAKDKLLKVRKDAKELTTKSQLYSTDAQLPQLKSGNTYLPPVKAFKCYRESQEILVLPCVNIDNVVNGYVEIASDSKVTYQTNFRILGSFFYLGDLFGSDKNIFLTDNYLTGIAIYLCLGDSYPVVCSFDSINMIEVAKVLRTKVGPREIIGCANNVFKLDKEAQKKIIGKSGMAKAINPINGQFILPTFDAIENTELKRQVDFCDLYVLAGVECTRNQLLGNIRLPVRFEKKEYLPVELASKEIGYTILNFFREKQSQLLVASAGLGKTTQAVKVLKQYLSNHTEHDTVCTFYMPAKKNQKEITELLRTEGIRTDMIEGRHIDNCFKYEQASQLAALGGARVIAECLCGKDDSTEKCEKYDSCGWRKQFEPAEQPQAIVLTHAHLGLPNNKLEKKLYGTGVDKFAVIDESFFNTSRRLIVPTEQFQKCARKMNLEHYQIFGLIWKCLVNGTPLLSTLRSRKISTGDLKSIANEIQEKLPKFGQITPKMSIQEITALLDAIAKAEKKYNVSVVLKLIADELSINLQRDECHAIRVKDKNIICNWFKSIKRLEKSPEPRTNEDYIPTLVIDATAKSEVTQAILGLPEPIGVSEVSVKRNVHVTQLCSNENSSCNIRSERGIRVLDDASFIANKRAKEGEKVLVVGSMEFVENEAFKNAMKSKNIAIEHFGGLRGIDKYKDFNTVVIVGRFQPPADAIEDMARGLFRLDNQPLELGSTKLDTAYSLKDGQVFWPVWTPKDSRIADLNSYYANAEILQVIDRLRLIHCEEKKEVFLLTARPIDGLEVDKIVTTEEIRNHQKKLDMVEVVCNFYFTGMAAIGIMPLTPAFLVQDGLFDNEKSAELFIGRNKQEVLSNVASIGNIRLLEYKIVGKKGGSPLKVITSYSNEETKAYLSKRQ